MHIVGQVDQTNSNGQRHLAPHGAPKTVLQLATERDFGEPRGSHVISPTRTVQMHVRVRETKSEPKRWYTVGALSTLILINMTNDTEGDR